VSEGLFDYENWRPHSDWSHAERGDDEYDRIDYHVDLGCGTLKKGRIGIDRFPAQGVNVVMNFETRTSRDRCVGVCRSRTTRSSR
jgi:trans-aconitate methyltransferase